MVLFLHPLLDIGNDDDYEHGLLPANVCNAVKKTMTTVTSNVTGLSNSTTGPSLAPPVEMVWNLHWFCACVEKHSD
jgi:hypothetical protein